MSGHNYRDLTDGTVSEDTVFFLDQIIRSRIATKNQTCTKIYDEDVNMYLAGMLQRWSKNAMQETSKYVRNEVTAVADLVKKEDLRIRFEAYKANADHLFMRLSFGDMSEEKEQAPTIKSVNKESRRWYEWSRRQNIGKCESYYSMAGTIGRGKLARVQGLSEVFSKISDYIDMYLEIVKHANARLEGGLKQRITDGSMYHLALDSHSLTKSEMNKLLDDFLIDYTKFKETPSSELAVSLEEKIQMLEKNKKNSGLIMNFEKPRKNIDEYNSGNKIVKVSY